MAKPDPVIRSGEAVLRKLDSGVKRYTHHEVAALKDMYSRLLQSGAAFESIAAAKPGDVVYIRPLAALPPDGLAALTVQLRAAEKKTGVQMLVIQGMDAVVVPGGLSTLAKLIC